jgi:predicted transcriptional regulator
MKKMNSEEFVKSIIEVVREESISDSIEDLVDPPGRKPSSEDIELSSWFNQLNDKDKEIIAKVVKRATDTTIFGFFTVLDGVRAIENDSNKGKLELYYKKNENINLLNNNQDEYLHDIFNNQIKD